VGGNWGAAVSDDYTVTGTTKFEYQGVADVTMAAYWTPTGNWAPIYGFPGATTCGTLSIAWDMSANGRFVAGHSWRDDWSCHTHGMVYDIDTGTMYRYAGVGNHSTSVKDVSDDGKLAVGWEQTTNRIPVIWDEFGIPMHIPGATVGEATAVSADGQWAGGRMQDSGFLWSEATGVVKIGNLPVPQYTAAEPLSMSYDGSIVVGGHLIAGSAGIHGGWIWTAATGMVSIRDYALSLGIAQAATWGIDYVPHGIADDGSAILINYGMGQSKLLKIDIGDACELDWNCDGVVTFSDVYESLGGLDSVQDKGFYADVHYHTVYGAGPYASYVDGGYYHKQQCGEPGNLDWDGNATIEMIDAYAGSPGLANLGAFYTQFWLYDTYPAYYSYYYPDSFCS